MYWPIGAPRTYAATKHELRRQHKTAVTNDGLQDVIGEEEPENETTSPTRAVETSNGRARARSEDTIRPGDLNGSFTDGVPEGIGDAIVDMASSRNGQLFVTATSTTVSVWQAKPTTLVASVVRSTHSLQSYGPNQHVMLRPDSAIVVIQTAMDFLITYSLVIDPSTQVYKFTYPDHGSGHARHKSLSGQAVRQGEDPHWGPGEGHGVREISMQFKMVIKLESGISKVLALDDELIVATNKPAAMQCILWTPDKSGSQHSTHLLKNIPWIAKDVFVTDMVFDRPMNLSTWITSDGHAYAVQRTKARRRSDGSLGQRAFQGYAFHTPDSEATKAVKAAINARFSLVTVGCANGQILVYNAKDYTGNITLSHTVKPPPAASSGHGCLTFLSYSPDGYCLFAGYERGWATWSVYGKPGACSFTAERTISEANSEQWLLGIKEGIWLGGGSQIVLHGQEDNELWILDMARSAIVGNFSPANVSRSLLQTNAGLMLYRGHDLPTLTAVSTESGFWHHVEVPITYLARQWPIRSAVISNDGRYVAVAGRRGLAHYSVNSGRWKTFEDQGAENDFTVRGGMCWLQHVLVAAVETSYDTFELRVYSRESTLDNNNIMHVEQLDSAVVIIAPSGSDSLLVYTYSNLLLHYIITANNSSVKLLQVGQIALNGIIRAPPRVRALSWILPEEQLENGDPSQDVALATILFLVDGKLVSLQPATKETGELKYEMRIIAQNVEYYALMRERQNSSPSLQAPANGAATILSREPEVPLYYQNDLRDSLWIFDGTDMRVWTDVQDVLASASPELARELPEPVKIPVDFYPLSTVLDKGVLFGVESEMVQRRDTNFAYIRNVIRTHLFLPQVLRYHIGQYNTPSALYLSHRYQHLPYFMHALEVLLHDVLDEEVDNPPPEDHALLPSVLSFLSSFPSFLAIILQCTRKTEVRSWRTLFAHLPSPQELFAQSLERGDLKTAGGYLLVLHTLEDEAGAKSSSKQVVELLKRAKDEGEWELCKELARFLRALDEDGSTLQRALEDVGLASPRRDGMTLRTSRLSISSGNVRPSSMNGLTAEAELLNLHRNVIDDDDKSDKQEYFS
ncbi:uncharacterized protein PV09_02422 [Verruconis gallopava]|uniref:RIC1 C-terminal alpha solenoid region domain-containing protein n=1 Tax=Verruconis gallopava TaxID=253628 RepID=A0A0D2AIK7_9PEZI|nr:uncharacterized protein PV09_02422 [Verruconis gallopava]KIW06728.1 hypothetical protein PV09_02422 [Verruconis gallopava]